MAKRNSTNLDMTPNADGFDISGGTTARKLTNTAGDVTITGGNANTYTFPAATDTLMGLASTDTITGVKTFGAGKIIVDGNVSGLKRHWRVAIFMPNAIGITTSTVIPISITDAALTVTNLECRTSSASYEVAGDLKWADARIGLGSAAVIETFDTSSGVRTDSSIASGSVASGKFVYLQFDSAPNASMTDVLFDITWDYD